jgi:hypothetical protein
MGQKFNPPPGWPAPPPGWQPSPGWRPDPAWPPPPAGWKLWIGDSDPVRSPRSNISPRHRRRVPQDVRRAIARNSVLAVAASIVGAVGFQSITKERTEFASLVTAFLGSLIYFWFLRIPAALLELYITKTRSRRWIYWPSGIAAGIVVVSIAGDNANLYRGDEFRNLLTLQAATFGLLEYLLCALILLSLAAALIFVRHRVVLRRGSAGDEDIQEPTTAHTTRRQRKRKAPTRDAAVLALSITLSITGVVQAFNIHNPGQTVLALAAGAVGFYFLRRLPALPPDEEDPPPADTPGYALTSEHAATTHVVDKPESP